MTGGSRGIGRAVVERLARDGAAVVFSFLQAKIADVLEEDLDRVLDVNLKGTLFAMQEAARRMRHGGRVINISTVNTVMPTPGVGAYSATKAAVGQLTRVGALELGAREITVNTVSPGATDTELFHQSNPPCTVELVAGLTPLGRIGQPADVADVVAFLADPDARWLTGQHLRASGGLDVGRSPSVR